MIRTHIRIAHLASIRTGSPVDSRQCDWGITEVNLISRVSLFLLDVRSKHGNASVLT